MKNKKNTDPNEVARKLLEQMSRDVICGIDGKLITIKEYLGASLIETNKEVIELGSVIVKNSKKDIEKLNKLRNER